MKSTGKLHALAATARVANLPSVVSNVLLGIALGTSASNGLSNAHTLGIFALLAAAGVLLYLAGAFLNDWADRDWDQQHRPERALARGIFPPGFYLIVAVACGTLGICAAGAVRLQCLGVALVIGVSVVLYTGIHKRSVGSVVPMGLCRALLPVMGYVGIASTGVSPVPGWSHATAALTACGMGLFSHIAGLSLSARYESVPQAPAGDLRLGRWLFPAAALTVFLAALIARALPAALCLLGLLPYALWMVLCLTVFRRPVAAHVSNLLAGIPLVDWIFLLPLSLGSGSNPLTAPIAAACLWIPPLAFIFGKLLQRLAPAT